MTGGKIRTVILQVFVSGFVLALGGLLLFPESIFPLIRLKTAGALSPAGNRPEPAPESPPESFGNPPELRDRDLKILRGSQCEVRSYTQRVAGTRENARMEVDSRMRKAGYSLLPSGSVMFQEMSIYLKGRSLTGVTFFPRSSSSVEIVFCEMSFSGSSAGWNLKPEIGNILFGKTLLAFQGGNRCPVVVTNSSSGKQRILAAQREKFRKHGWELQNTDGSSARESDVMFLLAKRGTLLCNVTISSGGGDQTGTNIITYKIMYL